MNIFVTGTDTDVGKTFISALLCKRWGANYWKPIQTGLESDCGDTVSVYKLSGVQALCEPALMYQKPLSPWRAAVLEDRERIDISSISIPKKYKEDDKPLIVEGAGGVFVPITETEITTDLVEQLRCPVIIVARSQLGTLNHTLLTLEHLKRRNVEVLGVILNGDLDEDNAKTLKAYGANVICQIPRANNVDEVIHLVPELHKVYSS